MLSTTFFVSVLYLVLFCIHVCIDDVIEKKTEEILSEINNLNNKKVGSYKNIPTKILKESSEISSEYLTKIWNEQVIMQKNYKNELKLADIILILKKDDSTLAKNYMLVSALCCVSKILREKCKTVISIHIHYRKGFST